MKTARFAQAQIWTLGQSDSGNAVFVRPPDSELALPVYVGENDIQLILVELTHILAPRPMVHELLLSVVDSLHGRLERVEIYGIRYGSYLCRVILVQDDREIVLESRPSDILCIAARMSCPIMIDESVLAKNGVPVETVEKAQMKGSSDGADGFTAWLHRELSTAVEREDYERAAVLRDQIAGIEGLPPEHHI